MDLSVIIPVYKTEAYLNECVNSILTSTEQNIEVVLVDDGSPDNCPQLCDDYSRLDSRIKVVHKINGGLSSARNAGLQVACGKYVAFLDSDDMIYTTCIPQILAWIKTEGTDLCFLQAEKFYPDGTRENLGECIERDSLRSRTREEAIAHLASRPKYPGSAWAKLYRREFLLEHDLHFPYDRRYSEDLGFMRDCILSAKDFDFLPVPFYQYRQNRQGSITNTVTAKNFHDLFLFITESDEKLNIRENNNAVSKSVMSFVAYEYSILLYLYSHLPAEDQKNSLEKLKKYSWTLKYARSKKGRMTGMACSLFGVRFTSCLLELYRKMSRK